MDDYLDEKIRTLDKKKGSADEVNRALASPFPSQVVQVDVTGQGFDRMKRNRRSLVIHTKRIRRSKRRNTICGSMPNKECEQNLIIFLFLLMVMLHKNVC